jgi:hypothetical protein
MTEDGAVCVAELEELMALVHLQLQEQTAIFLAGASPDQLEIAAAERPARPDLPAAGAQRQFSDVRWAMVSSARAAFEAQILIGRAEAPELRASGVGRPLSFAETEATPAAASVESPGGAVVCPEGSEPAVIRQVHRHVAPQASVVLSEEPEVDRQFPSSAL